MSSFPTSSAKFSKFDTGNMIFFQNKVFGTNIKEMTPARYLIKVTASLILLDWESLGE